MGDHVELRGMNRASRLGLVLLATALVSAACDRGPDAEQESADEVVEEAPAAVIQPSPVGAPLQVVDVEGVVEADNVPEGIASPASHWYQADGRYVVVFAGVSAERFGPLCPGSALHDGDDFLHSSLAQTGTDEEGCEGAEQDMSLSRPIEELGGKVCDGLIILGTEIPASGEGALLVWLPIELVDGNEGEVNVPPGSVQADPEAPEIDLQAASYEIPADFLPDGAEIVTC